MFERFTDRARRVVVLAQEEARLLGHPWIGTEHMLLGIIREGEGVGSQVLKDFGLTLEWTRGAVEARYQNREVDPPGTNVAIPFTPNAKKTNESALREALQLGHNYIGTEHLLLGLARGGGMGASILASRGLDVSTVRQAVIKKLSLYTPAADTKKAKPHNGALTVEIMEWEAVSAIAWVNSFFDTFPGQRTPTHPLYPLSIALERARQVAE